MEYALADAATAAGVNRSTILRAIKSGKLSARRLDDKSYRVDASELVRVFNLHKPLPNAPEAMLGHAQAAQGNAQDLIATVEMAKLREKVVSLERERETYREMVEDYRETVGDLRKRLDRAEERVLALTVQPTPQPVQSVHEPPPVIEELRRRLEETEAHLRALVTLAPPTPLAGQERPSEPHGGMTPAWALRGLLARLLGLGRGSP